MTTDEAFELPGTARIGRVALRVGSIDGVLGTYRDVLGAEVERDGDHAKILADGTPLLALAEAPDAPERGDDEAGLFHAAIRVPDRGALGDALARIRESDLSLTGASDHLVSEALYLRDPEGNGLEVYRDRPREEWERTEDGGVELDTLPLDLDDLAAEARGEERLPAGTDVGHVHLEVTALDRVGGFYRDTLGLRLRARYGASAWFLAAGDYHHHLGLNVWNRRTQPSGGGRGLEWFEIILPDAGTLATVRERLEDHGHAVEERDGGPLTADPDDIELRLTVADGSE